MLSILVNGELINLQPEFNCSFPAIDATVVYWGSTGTLVCGSAVFETSEEPNFAFVPQLSSLRFLVQLQNFEQDRILLQAVATHGCLGAQDIAEVVAILEPRFRTAATVLLANNATQEIVKFKERHVDKEKIVFKQPAAKREDWQLPLAEDKAPILDLWASSRKKKSWRTCTASFSTMMRYFQRVNKAFKWETVEKTTMLYAV